MPTKLLLIPLFLYHCGQILALLADALVEIQEQVMVDNEEVTNMLFHVIQSQHFLIWVLTFQFCCRTVIGKKFGKEMRKLIKIWCIWKGQHPTDLHMNISKQWLKLLMRFSPLYMHLFSDKCHIAVPYFPLARNYTWNCLLL